MLKFSLPSFPSPWFLWPLFLAIWKWVSVLIYGLLSQTVVWHATLLRDKTALVVNSCMYTSLTSRYQRLICRTSRLPSEWRLVRSTCANWSGDSSDLSAARSFTLVTVLWTSACSVLALSWTPTRDVAYGSRLTTEWTQLVIWCHCVQYCIENLKQKTESPCYSSSLIRWITL